MAIVGQNASFAVHENKHRPSLLTPHGEVTKQMDIVVEERPRTGLMVLVRCMYAIIEKCYRDIRVVDECDPDSFEWLPDLRSYGEEGEAGKFRLA